MKLSGQATSRGELARATDERAPHPRHGARPRLRWLRLGSCVSSGLPCPCSIGSCPRSLRASSRSAARHASQLGDLSHGSRSGTHGVFDFTTRHGYGVRFTGSTSAKQTSSQGSIMGLKTACLGFPGTYPRATAPWRVHERMGPRRVTDRTFVHPLPIRRARASIRGDTLDDVDDFTRTREGFTRLS